LQTCCFLVIVLSVVQAVTLSSENESSSQTNDCAHLIQKCLIDANGCEQSWRSMEDTCLTPGKNPVLKVHPNDFFFPT
jgi:hypothetical protein